MLPQKSFVTHYDRLLSQAGDQPAWLRDLRGAAIAHFEKAGFPTMRDEDWKYTSVAPIADTPFVLPETSDLAAARRVLSAVEGGRKMVFVNGRFARELSSIGELPKGAVARGLAGDFSQLEGRMAGADFFQRHPFAALNTALAEDGACVVLPRDAALEGPLHLVFVTVPGPAPHAAHPRSLIVAEPGSKATLVETWLGPDGARYFNNAVIEVHLGENASLEHYKIQREGTDAFHVANTRIVQERGSRYVSHSISLGGALVRNDLASVLGAEESECVFNGLYMATGRQHVDNHTLIDHAKPHCKSTEVYKGVLDGAARGVFNGKVVVRPHAQKTDARQSNKNLLLSEEASIDTKPQLEIFNDDVKCSHGAAVGQLDEDALFYLRARGLPLEAARNVLTFAFASEVLESMGLAPLRARLEDVVHGWLTPGGKA